MIQWQRPCAKPWLRTVAFLTALAFTTTNVVWADGVRLLQSSREQSLPQAEIKHEEPAAANLFHSLSVPDSIAPGAGMGSPCWKAPSPLRAWNVSSSAGSRMTPISDFPARDTRAMETE